MNDIRLFEEQHLAKGQKKHEEVGVFLNTFVGRAVSPFVEMGSSGGIGSALAAGWIECENGICIGVKQTHLVKHPLFETVHISESAAIKDIAGSKYYPVEFSKILKTIESNVPLLLFCLPCVAYALFRLRQKKPDRFGKLVIVGLTCGHCPTARFSDFLRNNQERSGSHIVFRDHEESVNSYTNYAMRIDTETLSGETKRRIPFSHSLYGLSFINWMFSMNACRFCDDTFGAFADLSLMDAWLPDYIKNMAGTSLVICRTRFGQRLLDAAQEKGWIILEHITPDAVARSQRGVLYNKTERLSILVSLTRAKVPVMRYETFSICRMIGEIPSISRVWRAVKLCPLLYRMGLRSYAVPFFSMLDPVQLLRLLVKQLMRRGKIKF